LVLYPSSDGVEDVVIDFFYDISTPSSKVCQKPTTAPVGGFFDGMPPPSSSSVGWMFVRYFLGFDQLFDDK
jgi:hypothetical protein